MLTSKPLRSVITLAAMCLAASWAMATEITAAQGQVRHEVYGAPSPTPGYCYWDGPEVPVAAFHATEADGHGNMGCPHSWVAHCDGDSLVFRGSWPVIEATNITSANYWVNLECTVVFAVDTRLTAIRSVQVGGPGSPGVLEEDSHTLELTPEGDTTVTLLAAGAGPDQCELVVPPGTYRLSLHVSARKNAFGSGRIDSYAGAVRVTWSADVVGTEPLSWSAVKAAFRD